MKFVRVLSLQLLIAVFFLTPVLHADAKELKGEYKLLDGLLKVKGAKEFPKPEVIEFFNFGCSHCYDFLHKGLEEKFIAKFKDRIEYKDVPIFWGQQTHYPGLLYDWVKGDNGDDIAMKKAIFTAYFEDRANIFDKRIASMLTDDFNLGNKLFSSGNNPDTVPEVQKDLKLAQKLNVHETPTVIINRSIVITPSMSGHSIEEFEANLEKVLSSLLETYYKE